MAVNPGFGTLLAVLLVAACCNYARAITCGATPTSGCPAAQQDILVFQCEQADTGNPATVGVGNCVSGTLFGSTPTSCGVYQTNPSICNVNYDYTYTVPPNPAAQNPVLKVQCPPGFYLASVGAWDQSQPGTVIQGWVDETDTGYISINQVADVNTIVKVYAHCHT